MAAAPRLGWREAIEATVAGLNFELVDVERAPRGLLRIFIDRRPGQAYPAGESEFVLVADCEQVTRQLQYALEVEGLDYSRLEVSSPGLDRPLKVEADFARFVGHEVNLSFKLPFQGRKNFRGVLQGSAGAWSLLMSSTSKLGKKEAKAEQQLDFALSELREARLVPVLDFKGRRGHEPAHDADAHATTSPEVHGGQLR
jgi:ribosome maturation factor RimP